MSLPIHEADFPRVLRIAIGHSEDLTVALGGPICRRPMIPSVIPNVATRTFQWKTDLVKRFPENCLFNVYHSLTRAFYAVQDRIMQSTDALRKNGPIRHPDDFPDVRMIRNASFWSLSLFIAARRPLGQYGNAPHTVILESLKFYQNFGRTWMVGEFLRRGGQFWVIMGYIFPPRLPPRTRNIHGARFRMRSEFYGAVDSRICPHRSAIISDPGT